MQSETKLTSRLVRGGRTARAMILNVHGHKMQTPGWPDLYIAHKLWTGFLEMKGPRTKIEPHQQQIIGGLKERNVSVYVVRFIGQEDSWWRFRIQDEYDRRHKIFEIEDTEAKVFVELMTKLMLLESDEE